MSKNISENVVNLLDTESRFISYENVIKSFVGILVFVLWLTVCLVTNKCQEESVLRRFPPESQRMLYIYAEGGDVTRAEPNTEQAFLYALEYTKRFKISVHYLSSDAVFVVQTRNIPFACIVTLNDIAPAQIMTLDVMLQFASVHEVTLLIEFVPCLTHSSHPAAMTVQDAYLYINNLALNTYALPPARIQFQVWSGDMARQVTSSLGITDPSRLMLLKNGLETFATAFVSGDYIDVFPESDSNRVSVHARDQANIPLSLSAYPQDLWTCSTHQRVFSDTWLHIRDVGMYMKHVVCYSAATSLQTTDPGSAYRAAEACGVAV